MKVSMNSIRAGILLVLACLVGPGLRSAVIQVPADEPTIQAGIDAALPGDTVLVADGVYTGNGNRDIDFGGKNIHLKSVNGATSTIIDCQGSDTSQGRGFYFHSGERTTAIVEGFTIRNGYEYSCGGGRCGGGGGAVFCTNDSSPTIRNNIIKDCTALIGGAIYMFRSHPIIVGNIIAENTIVSQNSGAIHCSNSNAVLLNNTIARNYSAGLRLGDSNLRIENTIIAFNRGKSIQCVFANNPSLVCCNLYGNDSGNWVDCIAAQEYTNNNFSADPLFCDTAASDYHLSKFSPCSPAYSSCGALVGALEVGCFGPYPCGDVNKDGQVTSEDALLLESYYFDCFDAPQPIYSSDLNCNGSLDVGDIILLNRYLADDGAPLCCDY